MNSLEGEFKVLKDATWEGSYVLVDNASTYFALDQTFILENTEATGNIKLPLYHVWNGVVLTLDTTGAAVTLSATATEDIDNTPTSDHWSLVGSAINGAANWDNTNGLEFVESDVEGVFTLTLESLSGEFKVLKNKVWAGSHILADSGVEFDKGRDYSLIQQDGAGNIVMVSGVTLTNVTLTLTVDGDNVTLRADAEGSVATKDTYMIVGDFNSWSCENNPINLLDDDNDNVYVGTVAEMSGVHTFKVVKNSSWDTCYGTSGNDLVVSEAYMPSLTNSGNIAFADNSVLYKEVTFTFDANTETLTVTATSTESLVTTWTLVGDFNSWSTETSLEFTATEDAGVYKLSLNELSGAFKVLKNNAWGGSYITSEVFTTGAEFVLENRDESGYNIVIAEDATWTNVELTLTVGDEVKLSATAGTVTGIESVEIESNEAVEYFNLQGVRVENPEAGLFIRKQGNKVTKVLVK